MSFFNAQAVYDKDGKVINYCVYKDEFECVYDTLSFTNNLKTVKERDLTTLQNKAISLAYWYNYLEETGQVADNFFTLEEQLEFISHLKTKTNYQKKKPIYVAGSDPYQKGLAATTIQIHISNIREYYIYLQSHGMISIPQEYLPFRKDLEIRVKNKQSKNSLPPVLTIPEIRRLVDACTTLRDKAIVLTISSTGMRLGELCALTFAALDFKNRTVKLKTEYLDLETGRLKTGERIVKGTSSMFNMIQRYMLYERSKVAKCDNVFVVLNNNAGTAGTPLTEGSIQKFFIRMKKKTGIKNCHAHVLRHTFATNFLAMKEKNDKVSLAALQKLLGHKDISTTMIYTHLEYSLDDFKECAEFEALIDSAMKGV